MILPFQLPTPSRGRGARPGFCAFLALFALIVGPATPASGQDRELFFDTTDPGVDKSIPTWGLDTAWLNEDNVRRGVIFMGQPQVDVVRVSFTGDWPLAAGDLGVDAQAEFDARMAIVDNHTEADTALYLNNDTGTADPSFIAGAGVDAAAWAELIDVTRQKCEDEGRTVVSVAPFNEPDFATWQGDVNRFGDVCWQLRNPYAADFSGIRLMGGNTLNNGVAAGWYDPLDGWGYLEEGNTHQLAGDFDSYATFFQTVAGNGDVGCNDELHNVMEAMVGAEYGMDAAIWWGPAEYARGEFVKASDGDRLAYAEHRPNWTAASVYRAPDSRVQAFVGESERQALPTEYRFVSKDRDVFFDGQGPQRVFTVTTTGGPGYATAAHRSAEKVVNITWGDDVQPAIDGRYILVARHSGKVMEVAGGGAGDGPNIQQGTHTGATHQQWDVNPVPSSAGGDYSYFTIIAAHSGKAADLQNFSYGNGGNIHQWGDGGGVNQQWILEYVEDGWFHIRSRWSGKLLDVAGNSTGDGANIHQWEETGGLNQQWRLVPAGASLDFLRPNPPANLVATPNAVSVSLSWDANGEADLAGYHVYRAAAAAGPYSIVARDLTTNAYVDESANQAVPYHYRVKAVDESLNRSFYSGSASATPTGDPVLVAHLEFEGSLDDSAGHANHAEAFGSVGYGSGWIGGQALDLAGAGHLLLPPEVLNHGEVTIASWVRWDGGSDWQRVFDFGCGESQYLFLTPKAGGGGLRFGINDGGGEQQLNAPTLAIGEWVHVAVTLGPATSRLYLNGAIADESNLVTIRPSDINPVLNLIGDSQFPGDPLYSGEIDDFRIYNHELSPAEVAELFHQGSTVAFWDFEDGVAGQAFTPTGQANGSGGSVDVEAGILMRGWDDFGGPSWTGAVPPHGGGLAMDCADNHQDGYVTEGALHGWSPGAWTIECTALLEDLTGWLTLIGRDGSSQAVAESDFYLQNNGIDDRFRISIATVGGTRWILDGTYPVQTNTWYALAARSDGATLSLWLDDGSGYQQIGSLDISAQSAADNALPATNLNWTFGRGWFGGGLVNHIDGRMDNIRFSAAALDPQDMIPLHPVPQAPTGLAASVSSSSGVGLSWTASDWASSYTVKRADTPGGLHVVVASGITATSFDDTGVVPGEDYHYVVSAVNSTGESTDSAEEGATVWTIAEDWRFGHFGTTANAGIAADGEDPDGDGTINLLERAFAGDPNLAEHDLMPRIDPAAPMLAILYRKAVDATDLDFEVEENQVLSGPWVPASGSGTIVSDDGTVQQIRFTRPVGSESSLFLRLAVE